MLIMRVGLFGGVLFFFVVLFLVFFLNAAGLEEL